MKIKVGSQNKVKIEGVREGVKLYPNIFPDPEVEGANISIEEFGHPKSMDEITGGAIERAKQSFEDASFGFGLESGMIEVKDSKSGYMEIQVCAIFDGENIHLGLAPGFEWPRNVSELILSGEADGSLAFKMAGYTENDKQGAVSGGIIGILSNGRKTREQLIIDSIIMAMVHLEHPDKY